MSKTSLTFYPVNPITLGRIIGVFGILGWIKIRSFTEKLDNIFLYQPWFINQINKWHKLEVNNWKYHNNCMIVKIKNIDNRNIANELNNHEIIIDAAQLPQLNQGDYYLKDLLECKVINIKGYNMGTVMDFIETGSNHVIVIKQTKNSLNEKEMLIPFIKNQTIKKVDIYKKIIEVDWDPIF
ncbi:ribosome maturation factor RimM [Candidatus Pantoea edessiphila]|uniref:Ribosome maturation factor RimM n=1 Tax=Candidatus Pantoea edessiphila TaxID=2044610 RepID=A0A2P5SXN5_9GAMM|nr:ribosome maturation factor RimM [Candidatus Pantoea edessiphila]MBK4775667.1 ribosome maturation factor RimM [Pantoea sp. Edef]PPI87101.1 ribosome maturation factor RimM [Candidatus Pantoea edessiphila]